MTALNEASTIVGLIASFAGLIGVITVIWAILHHFRHAHDFRESIKHNSLGQWVPIVVTGPSIYLEIQTPIVSICNLLEQKRKLCNARYGKAEWLTAKKKKSYYNSSWVHFLECIDEMPEQYKTRACRKREQKSTAHAPKMIGGVQPMQWNGPDLVGLCSILGFVKMGKSSDEATMSRNEVWCGPLGFLIFQTLSGTLVAYFRPTPTKRDILPVGLLQYYRITDLASASDSDPEQNAYDQDSTLPSTVPDIERRVWQACGAVRLLEHGQEKCKDSVHCNGCKKRHKDSEDRDGECNKGVHCDGCERHEDCKASVHCDGCQNSHECMAGVHCNGCEYPEAIYFDTAPREGANGMMIELDRNFFYQVNAGVSASLWGLENRVVSIIQSKHPYPDPQRTTQQKFGSLIFKDQETVESVKSLLLAFVPDEYYFSGYKSLSNSLEPFLINVGKVWDDLSTFLTGYEDPSKSDHTCQETHPDLGVALYAQCTIEYRPPKIIKDKSPFLTGHLGRKRIDHPFRRTHHIIKDKCSLNALQVIEQFQLHKNFNERDTRMSINDIRALARAHALVRARIGKSLNLVWGFLCSPELLPFIAEYLGKRGLSLNDFKKLKLTISKDNIGVEYPNLKDAPRKFSILSTEQPASENPEKFNAEQILLSIIDVLLIYSWWAESWPTDISDYASRIPRTVLMI